MDTVRRTAADGSWSGRRASLLALSLAAATSFSLASPVTAAAPSVHVVVTAAQDGVAGVAAAARAVLAAGGTVDTKLPLVGGVSATLPADAVLPPSFVVADDRPIQLSGGAAAAGGNSSIREALGLGAPAGEGEGVTVAVVDTGVADVADLAGRVTHVNVTGEGTGDGYGHGTFVAGLVAGDGSSSNGLYAGVAPAADILDVRVANADGSTSLSLVLAGLQEVARRPQVDVVNLSLSSGSPLPYQVDPLTQALERLWERGTVVVVPSGNDGEEAPAGTVTSPGVDPMLLTVGGLNHFDTAERGDDVVAPWSGRGPAPQNVAKPEIVAPGTSVVSLRAPGSMADENNPGSVVGDDYFRGSGTSFATAVASGAAAALLDSRNLTPDQVKGLLTATSYDVPESDAGGLDAAAADVAPAPARVNDGRPGHPGLPRQWDALLEAFFDGDQAAAANSWSALPAAAKQWVARNWTSLSLEARNWTANSWSDLGWTAGPDASAEEWQARLWATQEWAARNWTARNWTANSWSARNWTAEEWAARNWTARNWTEDDGAARNWTARNWTARNWTARNWTQAEWEARNWTARNWTARNWTARNWTAIDWTS